MHRKRVAIIGLLALTLSHMATAGAWAQDRGADIVDLQDRLDTFQPQPVPKPTPAPVVPVTRMEPVYATVEEKQEKSLEERAKLLENEIAAKTVPSEGHGFLPEPTLSGLSDAQIDVLADALGLDGPMTAKEVSDAQPGFVPAAPGEQAPSSLLRQRIAAVGFNAIVSRGSENINKALVGGLGLPSDVLFKRIFTRRQVGTREVTKLVKGKRQTQLHFSAASQYSYTSNAFTRSVDTDSDMLMAPNANLILSIPIGSDADTLTFTGGTSFSRYDENFGLDDDTIQASASYLKVINRTFPHKGMKETVTVNFQTSSSYLPGFEGEPTSFYTPVVAWNRGGIPFGRALCPTNEDPENHCSKLSITLLTRHSWSNNTRLDNTLARALLGYSRGFTTMKKLSLSASAGVSGTHYDHFSDKERNEVQFDGGFSVNYIDGPVTVSGGMDYTHRTSSIAPLTYDRYRAIPNIKVKIKLGAWPKQASE